MRAEAPTSSLKWMRNGSPVASWDGLDDGIICTNIQCFGVKTICAISSPAPFRSPDKILRCELDVYTVKFNRLS